MANLRPRDLLSIEYIRVNKIDGIEFVEIDEDSTDINYGTDYKVVIVNIIEIYEIDDEKPVHIYGTVVVHEVLSKTELVYDRSSNNPETKAPGESLSLTGLFASIDGGYDVFISLCLWFHDGDGIVKGEIEGEIGWRPVRNVPRYDQLLENNVLGKYGSVTVGYLVISDAVSATIDVVMINDDRESNAAVYGTIKATSTLFHGLTRMLFQKSPNEYVQVSSQQCIPLTCEVFSVRVDSNFSIAVDLWDHYSSSPDDQIALGSVQFTARFGTAQTNITSKYGELQISITCK